MTHHGPRQRCRRVPCPPESGGRSRERRAPGLPRELQDLEVAGRGKPFAGADRRLGVRWSLAGAGAGARQSRAKGTDTVSGLLGPEGIGKSWVNRGEQGGGTRGVPGKGGPPARPWGTSWRWCGTRGGWVCGFRDGAVRVSTGRPPPPGRQPTGSENKEGGQVGCHPETPSKRPSGHHSYGRKGPRARRDTALTERPPQRRVQGHRGALASPTPAATSRGRGTADALSAPGFLKSKRPLTPAAATQVVTAAPAANGPGRRRLARFPSSHIEFSTTEHIKPAERQSCRVRPASISRLRKPAAGTCQGGASLALDSRSSGALSGTLKRQRPRGGLPLGRSAPREHEGRSSRAPAHLRLVCPAEDTRAPQGPLPIRQERGSTPAAPPGTDARHTSWAPPPLGAPRDGTRTAPGDGAAGRTRPQPGRDKPPPLLLGPPVLRSCFLVLPAELTSGLTLLVQRIA